MKKALSFLMVSFLMVSFLISANASADVFNLGNGKFLLVDASGNVRGATAQTLEQAKQELANQAHNASVSYNMQIEGINQEIADIDNALNSPVTTPELVDENIY